ncbi:hypothetical protein [Leyella stercorea]|uniref:hypothetical protein n=1 Tax=Leyella stercorea TaxID=363265 RepID=UPI002670DBC3|nr:hypothetical protein [Leyella stercorea]
MLVYIHQKNIAQAFILERYFFQLSGSKTREDSLFRMEDSPLRLADRLADMLADNPSLAISSSLYNSDNERRTAILEDMADFFTYLISC